MRKKENGEGRMRVSACTQKDTMQKWEAHKFAWQVGAELWLIGAKDGSSTDSFAFDIQYFDTSQASFASLNHV